MLWTLPALSVLVKTNTPVINEGLQSHHLWTESSFDVCLRAVSTFLPREWLLFPFPFLSLPCTIASHTAFNPANLLWVHLFRKRAPLYSQGLELPAWGCFYTQPGEGARGDTGKGSQGCPRSPKLSLHGVGWNTTVRAVLGWVSLSGCERGRAPGPLALNNLLGWCPGQFYCNILPDQARIPAGAHLPVYHVVKQGQGAKCKHLRNFKAFKAFGMPTVLAKSFLTRDTALLSRDRVTGTEIFWEQPGIWALRCWPLVLSWASHVPAALWFGFPSCKVGFLQVFILS